MLSLAKEAKMAKLTDTQLIVLSTAAARDDGAGVVPDRMNRAAVAKVGSSLVGRKLMREVRAKPGTPVWRQDETGRSFSLIITRAGRDAIGVENASETDQQVESNAGEKKIVDDKLSNSTPRSGSKQALVVAMLAGGATLDALIEATGWLPHTTRAALTGLRKRGYLLERIRGEGKRSAYRIAPDPKRAIPA